VTERSQTAPNAADRGILFALALVAVLATLEQAAMPFNSDASCLLAFTQRMLHGERLYRDLLEINPPLICAPLSGTSLGRGIHTAQPLSTCPCRTR